MSIKKASIFYIVAFFVQLSLLNVVSLAGVTPNLILCLAVYFTYRWHDGLPAGMAGVPFVLLLDGVSAPYFGVGGLCLFLVCLGVSYMARDVNKDHLLVFFTVSSAGIAAYELLYWIVMHLLGNPTGITAAMLHLLIALPQDLVFLLLVDFFIRQVRKKRGQRERAEAGTLKTRGNKQRRYRI